MTLEEVKAYLRVDGNDDDALISALITAAESYVIKLTNKRQVIVGVNADGTPITTIIQYDELWKLVNKLLIAHWYENRGDMATGNVTKISHSIDALINHIALCGDYV